MSFTAFLWSLLLVGLISVKWTVLYSQTVRGTETYDSYKQHMGYMLTLLATGITIVFGGPTLAGVIVLLVFAGLVGVFSTLVHARHNKGKNIKPFGIVTLVMLALLWLTIVVVMPPVITAF
jgi:hypothetical protein